MSATYVSKFTVVKECNADCIVIGVYAGNDLAVAPGSLKKPTAQSIQTLLDNRDLSKSVGSSTVLHLPTESNTTRIILVRLGAKDKLDASAYLKAVTGVARTLKSLRADTVAIFIGAIQVKDRGLKWQARRLVETLDYHVYKFRMQKKAGGRAKKWKFQVCSEDKKDLRLVRAGVRVGKAISEGVRLARDLGNLPGNVCSPTYLSERAQELGIEVTVHDEAQMREFGMGALLSVSAGSRQPAVLIVMQYAGGDKGASPVVLVGKGVTFDSGGISLKPGPKMDEMKFDMCGAAGVIGALHAAARLKLPLNIIGIVPATENLPDGIATKPGDVVTSYSGKTIEILNTDAEGRLILCDALTYAERFKPAVVVDAATLTGACVMALGKIPAGLFTEDDALADELLEAGQISGDRAWRLPLWDDYQNQLDSNFADIANIGGREGGAITAACFLSRFTSKFRWAHLDVAGTAWETGKNKGATGRPVNILTQFLIKRSQQAA